METQNPKIIMPISKSSRGDKNSLGIAIQVFVIFLGFWGAFDTILENSIKQRKEHFIESCSNDVQNLAVQSDPVLFLRSRILKILWHFKKNRLPKLARINELYKEKWGLDLTLYRFSPSGRLLESAPENTQNVWLIKNMYKGLVAPDGARFDEIRRRIDKKIPFVFGDGKDLMSIRENKGKPIETFSRGTSGSLAWESSKNGGMIIICDPNPSETEIFNKTLATFSKQKFSFVGFGRQGSSDFRKFGKDLDSLADQAWKELRAKKLLSGMAENLWWVFQETSTGRILYGAFQPFSNNLKKGLWVLRFVGLIIAISIFIIFWKGNLTASLSLRRILIGLFLAAAIFPLFAMTVCSLDLSEVYEAVTGTRIASAQNEAILNLIRGFEGFLVERGRRLDAATQNPGSGNDQKIIGEILEKVRIEGLLHQFNIRDAGGNILYSNVREYSPARDILNKSFARMAISKYAPNRLNEIPYKENVVTDAIVRANDMGFNEICGFESKLQLVQIGEENYLFYFRVYPSNLCRTAFVEIKLPVHQGVTCYLRERSAQRVGFQGLWLRFYAFDLENFCWTIPPPKSLGRNMASIALRSWMTGQAESDHFKKTENSGFVISHFCPQLAKHGLVAFCSDDLVKEQISNSWRVIIIGTLVFSFLLVVFVRGVSGNLLAPLIELEGGAEALISRDFDFRLETSETNEMGQLFRAFNQMMDESNDLQVARQVQEGLIPKDFPKIKGYSIEGKIFMASDLGGDCLDCFALKEGRVLFLVGDVSGHGVGSALLMAFSRAITFHWSQGDRLSPSVLAREIDQILRLRGSKSFMGAVCGVLDFENHSIEVNVEGHVFPLFLRVNEPPRWVGKAEFPLGVGKKPKEFYSAAIMMNPGDALIIATDGFVEALNKNNEPIGFERFAYWALETYCDNAGIWLNRMVERHKKWMNRQIDDLTILTLVRDKEPLE